MSKTTLDYNSFRERLLKRHDEYKGKNELHKVLPHIERGIKELLEYTKQGKVTAFINTLESKEFTWVEINKDVASKEEAERVKNISEFIMGIEEKLGYQRQPN